jgi:molybdopterin synthase sulfur carrier subunit
MGITVKYFASLSQQLGRREEVIDPTPGLTVAKVWDQVTGGVPLPSHILMAVNREYAKADTPVKEGDELAFFPPVTGGVA